MPIVKIRKLDGRKMVGRVVDINLTEGFVPPGEKIHIQGHGFFRVVKPRKVVGDACRKT